VRSLPNSRIRTGTITNGPNAATVAMAAALDLRNGLALSGRLSRIRRTITGDPAVSFRGDLGPLQSFRGWVAPNLRGLLPGAPMSLPITGAPDPTTGPFKATR